MRSIERSLFLILCGPLPSILYSLGLSAANLAPIPVVQAMLPQVSPMPLLSPMAQSEDVAASRLKPQSQPQSNQLVMRSTPSSAVKLLPSPIEPHDRHLGAPLIYPSFNSPQLDHQIQRYLNLLAESGPPDILILGSSRALQGVDPVVVQQTLMQRYHRTLTVFNFGVNGATAQVEAFILSQLLTATQLPRMIVWADGSRSFNGGRIDHTFNNLLMSPGYKYLAKGVRPTLPIQTVQSTPFCRDTSSFASRWLVPLSAIDLMGSGDRRAGQQGVCNGLSLSRLWAGAVYSEPQTPTTNPETLGFQVVTTRFNPATYFQRYPQVPGDYDADYREFRLAGPQITALKSVVTFAKLHQIPLVMVNLPLTDLYLDPTRAAYEQQFSLYLKQLSNSHSLPVLDYGQRWRDRHDYFMDPSHLNRYGANAVAAQLGNDLRLPWATY